MLDIKELLKEELTTEDYNKLIALDNPKLHAFIADAIGLTQPASVRIFTDAPEDMAYIRELSLRTHLVVGVQDCTCEWASVA